MKKILKKIIPKSYHSLLYRIYTTAKKIGKPRITFYQGNGKSVLNCCIAYNKYGGYCVPLLSIHRPAAQKILLGNVYEPNTIEFMVENSGKGDIVHAGTFFGDFLPALSMSLSEESILWAFEPNPENYRCASITTALNDLQNVQIMNAGLGDVNGRLPMMVSDDRGKSLGGASRIVKEQVSTNNNKQFLSVRIVSLDSVLPANRNISILQLDVEGLEREALIGAMQTIKRCKPILILENIPEEEWFSNYILSLGYKPEMELHDNKVFVCKKISND